MMGEYSSYTTNFLRLSIASYGPIEYTEYDESFAGMGEISLAFSLVIEYNLFCNTGQ